MRIILIAASVLAAIVAGLIVLGLSGSDPDQQVLPPSQPPPPLEPPPRPSEPPPAEPERRAHLVITPDQLRFEGPAGTRAAAVLRLANEGDAPAAPEIVLTGAAGDLAVEDGCSQGLPPGSSCSITLRAPVLPEGSREAVVLVLDQGRSGPTARISLTGAARPEPAPPVMPVQPPPVTQQPDPRDAIMAHLVEEMLASRRKEAHARSDMSVRPGPHGGFVPLSEDAGPPRQDAFESPVVVSSLPVDVTRMVTAGTQIALTLANAVSTERPGPVVAMVDSAVWASEVGRDGRVVVVPPGSRIIGRYESVSNVGSTRASFLWDRILMPTPAGGMAEFILDDPLLGADAQGRTGVAGIVDNRRLEKFGLPMLTSLIDAGVQIGVAALTGEGRGEATIFGTAAARPVSAFGDITRQLLDEAIDVRPIIQIPSGQRMSILVTRDLRLRRPGEPAPPPRDASGRPRPASDVPPPPAQSSNREADGSSAPRATAGQQSPSAGTSRRPVTSGVPPAP